MKQLRSYIEKNSFDYRTGSEGENEKNLGEGIFLMTSYALGAGDFSSNSTHVRCRRSSGLDASMFVFNFILEDLERKQWELRDSNQFHC